MKKSVLLVLVCLSIKTLMGQPYNRQVTINPGSGYVTVNELSVGYGLGETVIDYSRYFSGFTTTHGYQLNIYGLNVNSSLAAGAGTGIFIYNGGVLLPVYGDGRFTMNRKRVSPYVFVRSGLLFSLRDFNGQTRLFVQGGTGLNIKIDDQFAFCVSPGLLLQMGSNVSRDAFLSLNAGIVFKPLVNGR